MLRQRRDDPAAYVMGQTAVAEAFAASQDQPSLLSDAIAKRLAAQQAMALAPEERNALTKAERADILAGLRRLEAPERIAALAELSKVYGDLTALVAADLAEAGLSPVEVSVIDPSGHPAARERLARLVDSQRREKRAKAPEDAAIGRVIDRRLSGD